MLNRVSTSGARRDSGWPLQLAFALCSVLVPRSELAGQQGMNVELRAGYLRPLGTLGVLADRRDVLLNSSPIFGAGLEFGVSDRIQIRVSGVIGLSKGTLLRPAPNCVGGFECDRIVDKVGRFAAGGADVILRARSSVVVPFVALGLGVRKYHYGAVNIICLDVCDVTPFWRDDSSLFVRPALGIEVGRRVPVRMEVGPYLSRYRGQRSVLDLAATLAVLF